MIVMNKIKNIIIVLSVLILSYSCNDFLDEKPSKNSSLTITSVEQLDYLLNNYSSLYQEGNRTLIYGTDDYGLYKELTDAKSNAYAVAGVQFATWDIDNLPFDTREGYWSSEYNKIFTANLVLYNLPKVSGSDELKKKLKGEAHLMRAYSLWNLAQTYCLPYNEANKNELGLTLKESTSFEENVARGTLEETYNLIESDLQEALTLTNKMDYVNNKYKSWRGSKASANAFAARFYLTQGDYPKALEHANVALQEHGVLIDYNTEMRYSNNPSNVTVGGVAVEIKYPYTHDNQTDMTDMMEWKEFYYFRMLYHESWWYVPSKELLALYDKAYDLRYKYHMVENYSYDRGLTNPAYEYPGYVFFYKDRIPSGPTVAEMILIKAEALARDNKVGEAMTAVNQLRAKRIDSSAPSATINLTATDNKDAVLKILDERRREMPFSQRWNDIRRLNNNSETFDDIPELTREFYSYTNSAITTSGPVKTYKLEKGSRRFAAPIHDTEIESSNGAIKQNTY